MVESFTHVTRKNTIFSQLSAHPHIYIAHGAYWKEVASFQRTETVSTTLST